MYSIPIFGLLFWSIIGKFAYKIVTLWIGKKLRETLTALDDVPLLGIPRKHGQKIQGTSVICGGSVAGLLAARVCSDHFEDVVIVEPEGWVATAEGLQDRHRQSFFDSSVKKRTRVAQYISLHAFQPFMTVALRKLFQSFDQEIESEGARFFPADTSAHISGMPLFAPYHQYRNGALPEVMHITRPVFETVLRRLVLSTCSNVKYVTASVTALVPHASENSVDSVVCRSREGNEGMFSSALIVDCTGPAVGGLRWLQESTFENKIRPENIYKGSLALRDIKVTYDPRMLYTTCEFNVPSYISGKFKGIGLPRDYDTIGYLYTYIPDPKIDKRVLIITRREKHYLQIACGGWDDNTRLTTVSCIRSFIGKITPSFPLPKWIYSILDILEECDVPATYVRNRIPPSVYVQYHRATSLPSNFVALGDAVLLLNPVRGLGCTKACVDAVTLNALLGRSIPETSQEARIPKDFSRTFFATQARRTGALWTVFKATDYAWKSTIPAPGDDPSSSGAWRRWYSSKVTQLALKDRDVCGVMWRVGNWLAPQTDLFAPWILWRLALKGFKDNLSLNSPRPVA